MRSLCAKVQKERGEVIRKMFSDAELIDQKLMIKHNDAFLYIPLQSNPKSTPNSVFNQEQMKAEDIQLIEEDFEEYTERITNYT